MIVLESDKIILGDYNYEADEHEQTHVNNPQYKFAEFCKNKYNYKNDFKDILHTDEDDDEFIRISDIYQSKSSGSIKLNSIDDISIIENQAPCFLENHLNYQDNDKWFNKTYYFDESWNSKENTNSNIQSKILQRYEEGYAFANIKNQNKEFNDGLKHPSYFRTESIYDRLRNQIKFQNRINANSRSKAYQKFINSNIFSYFNRLK